MTLRSGHRARELGSMLRRRPHWVIGGVAVVIAGALLIGDAVSQPCGTSIAAIGCGEASLKPAAGRSVVTGYGHLTGRTRTVSGTPLHEIEIDHVQVLAGADRPATLTGLLATVPHPGAGTAAAQVPGLWAPDGHLLAMLSRNTDAVQESSTLQVRPVVGGDVVFSAAGCGGAPSALRTVVFHGPLTEVPGSRSTTVAECDGGFTSSPLQQVRRFLD